MRLPIHPKKSPFVIGVGGGTASGKSSVCVKIMERVGAENQRLVTMISQDSFYRELTAEERQKAFEGEFNFDHPDAIDFKAMLDVICELKHGKEVLIPKYDFRTHSRYFFSEQIFRFHRSRVIGLSVTVLLEWLSDSFDFQ
ncbi:unnamed protein product [Soboliphyme baturini]|uniref:PRK domain-containing protein n=1 Tax=Soboliphyme baturini TaxID=241478 RepID=A0A183IMY5_9BILA|nr:unnamed protein product [Soboliphyme baturini]